jgi:WD40 repeat protein
VSDDGTEQSSSAARPLYEMDLRDKLHSMTAFARGGVTYVVSAKWLDVTLSVWNAERRELEQLLDTRHTDGIRCLAASPELRLLVSGASDGLICLWEIS